MHVDSIQIFLKKYAAYFLGLLIFIPLLFSRPDLVICPSEKKYKLVVYSDNRGKTLTHAAYDGDQSIVFDYTLFENDSGSVTDPFAGFAIELTKNAPFIDISDYDYMQVDMIVKRSASFIINLKTYIEGFTNINDWHTYHVETNQIPVHFGSISYKIPLKDFRIPEWWWKEVGPIASNLPKTADRKKLFGMDFQNGSGAVGNVEDRMTIKRISFSKDSTPLYAIVGLCFLIYLFAVFMIRRSFRKRRDIKSDFSYKKLDVVNCATEESLRITDYIGKNFQNPDLIVDIVAHEVGIGESRISSVLQKACGMTFKQYLNEIRITEAKRLLKETDRTVTEIGFAVGYNNITHFNRVFKQDCDKSPSEFREVLLKK